LRSAPLNPVDLLYVLVVDSETIVVRRGVKTSPGTSRASVIARWQKGTYRGHTAHPPTGLRWRLS
jgi:hypothetical protein